MFYCWYRYRTEDVVDFVEDYMEWLTANRMNWQAVAELGGTWDGPSCIGQTCRQRCGEQFMDCGECSTCTGRESLFRDKFIHCFDAKVGRNSIKTTELEFLSNFEITTANAMLLSPTYGIACYVTIVFLYLLHVFSYASTFWIYEVVWRMGAPDPWSQPSQVSRTRLLRGTLPWETV